MAAFRSALAIFAIFLIAAGGHQAKAQDCVSIAEAATASNFTILATALSVAGLVETFSDPALSLTVFAPTDEAFTTAIANLGLTPTALLGDVATLTKILQHHVTATILEELEDGLEVASGFEETPLSIVVTEEGFAVESTGTKANILDAVPIIVCSTDDGDVVSSIVPIDYVLVPQAILEVLTGTAAAPAPAEA